MIPPIGKADRLLRRFCRTGDPRALGLLFDHAAPELLRAALWLCGDKSDAEDLLQRTFVTVIEARANYDAGRRAMPWLCGVLGNHARKLHERRERERGHHRRLTVLVQRDDHAAMSPADELAESEVVERIAMLRSELGSPYREVLDLHLGRGLKPAEIAAELGREPATVRTQLVRGLAKLRERVPLSLFSPLVAVALLTDGATGADLARIRAAVLERAADGASTATGATVAAKTALLAAAAMLGLGALALWATAAPTPAPPPSELEATAGGPPLVATGDPSGAPTRDAFAAGGAAAAEPDVASGSPPGSRRAGGLVVDALGRPVPHARLWLSLPNVAHLGGEVGECDDEGRFAIAFDGVRYLGARQAGHVGSYLHMVGGRDNPEGAALTLRLRGECGVAAGRVFDARGEPLAGAAVEIGLPGGWRVTNSTHERSVYPPRQTAATDDEGRFAIDGIEPGNVDVLIHAAGHSPLTDKLAIAPGRNDGLVFRLALGASVHGRVRGEHAQALAAATVVASAAGSELARARSGADGEFELGELPPGRVRITVEHATGSATAELDLAAAERRRWDPVLAAIEMVAGRVVDTELRPVAGIEVLVGGPTMAATAAVERTDADGRFRLAVASAGEAGVDLYLRRAGAPLAVRHGLLPVAGELLIELAEHELPSATIRGRILDRDGRPIAAALSVMNHGFQIAWYAFSDPATGAFRVGPTAPGSYTLIVEASGFGRRPLRVVNLAAGEDRELEDVGLEPAGRVELRLVGDASKQRKVLKFARDDGVVVAHSITEGSAVTVELPPGRYAATVVGGPFSGSTTILDLPAGRTVQRELPCIASARVALQLRAAAGHGIGGRVDVRVRDAAGAFFDAYELFAGNAAELTTTIALPPGSYAVELESTDGLAAATLLTVRSATDHPTLTIELR